ncbi:MAG: tRNA uridine-5-carboxymethylaminomethyl(34) synthesis GTPase MnmE [Zoogloeaceae bacterium]|jgi:tRNA modification GTPase|nr:tRNA uridine-5-carboxymethylaminomethyl(34) synthesis GTPase MnmE [Zoogloeaceae bacterium]
MTEFSCPPASAPIAAIATPPGRGGIGIVRLSGSALSAFAQRLTGNPVAPQARAAMLANFRDAAGSVIDQGLLLYFPAPSSFTGEDVLELHGHGGTTVMNLLLARCLELGARLADPGEFTRRAFLNGKLDLAEAEAVADLIDAATAAAARSAIRSLSGEFSRVIHALVAELTDLRLLVEATLDFPEEEIDFLREADAFCRMTRLAERLEEVRARARSGKLLQTGLSVVLLGQPNVGKSSLLNRLSGDELAIVTAIPGTTRDTLKSTIQIRGVPLHIIDTAGLRETGDEVEQIGIARAWRAAEEADIALLLVDARSGVAPEDKIILERLPERLPRLIAHNKIDLLDTKTDAPAQRTNGKRESVVALSAKTGAGLESLEDTLLEMVGWQGSEETFIARERHLNALKRAADFLAQAQIELESASPALELFAENLRLAQNALSEITGAFTPDDLLGEIFSRFCIGK